MGWLKDGKATVLRADAQKAWDDGRTVFTPKLMCPMGFGVSGGIDDWALMIEAIESVGWVMVDWAVGADDDRRLGAFPVFRRGR